MFPGESRGPGLQALWSQLWAPAFAGERLLMVVATHPQPPLKSSG
jgi:hypothetical protein